MAPTPCPACGAPLVLREEHAGQQACCPRCRHVFTAPQLVAAEPPAAPETVPTETPPPAPALSTMEDGSEQRHRRRRLRALFLALGLAAGVILLGCGGLATIIYVAYVHATEEPVTAADRAMVITAERLASFRPDAPWDLSRGTFRKVRHRDGSPELTYKYTTPDGAKDSLYIDCTVVIKSTERDAAVSYAGDALATWGSFRLQPGTDLQEVERNDLWKWGDESRCVLLTNNGKTVGNLFRARKGRRFFSILIAGAYFADADGIHELLAPIVEQLDGYNG